MAEKATMPTAPPSGPPPGGYPELPPSYDESVGAGGFVQPGPGGAAPKGSFQAAPPPPQMEPQQAGQQTVIVQYMNPPNFGPNPVRFLFLMKFHPKLIQVLKLITDKKTRKRRRSRVTQEMRENGNDGWE